MHSGNVGLSQDLDTVLDAAELLRDRARGALRDRGRGRLEGRPCSDRPRSGDSTNVEFLPFQDKADLSESLGAADVHLVGLRRGPRRLHRAEQGLRHPRRRQAVHRGRRAEAASPALIVSEHGCGVRIEPGDPRALADAVLEMRDGDLVGMGKRGREALETRFDRPIAAGRYLDLLESTVAAGPPLHYPVRRDPS